MSKKMKYAALSFIIVTILTYIRLSEAKILSVLTMLLVSIVFIVPVYAHGPSHAEHIKSLQRTKKIIKHQSRRDYPRYPGKWFKWIGGRQYLCKFNRCYKYHSESRFYYDRVAETPGLIYIFPSGYLAIDPDPYAPWSSYDLYR